MQRKIAEAESHELIIAKALPGNVAGKRAEQIRNTNALKDVSNLKAQVDKVQNVAVSSLPMSPSEEENLPQQLSPEVDEPISCLAEKTSTVLHSKTCAEPVKGKDIVDLCSDEEGNMVEASEKCKDSAAEDTPGKVMPDERFVSNDTQENATLSSGPLADAPSSSGPKSTKQGDTAPEGQCQEDNQSEEQSSGRPLSLKDFEGFFKKSSRKTFDINASTQDLESLGSGAVDTLELMTDVCNSLKQVPASEPDLVPMYEEPVSAAMHTDHEANQQKEKMLEQDIADMKKQMLMLENELQKTTAGKGTTDNSHKDSSASNDVVAMNGKDDNWDWDDSDGADEVMDVVPPTPPRKSRSINDGSFCSTTK
ncbi:hypothetical protein HPB52_019381 [Rhipicephalus sanguineus]|uniref:Uncharacterized protein n=1 Tax=Rhipicephalus sanguineus TaxID=34632 RepID=A0A9D4T1N0_RHISA|nr:hypothetical protein HPB52_019381 [Rhipicephalus sanguineus]